MLAHIYAPNKHKSPSSLRLSLLFHAEESNLLWAHRANLGLAYKKDTYLKIQV